jgi:hypothetical protein
LRTWFFQFVVTWIVVNHEPSFSLRHADIKHTLDYSINFLSIVVLLGQDPRIRVTQMS